MGIWSWLLACVLAGAIGSAAASTQEEAVALTLSSLVGLRTGDAALLTVEASHPLLTLEGEAFGRPVPFWPTKGERSWQGLLGVGLDVSAGTYDLALHAVSRDGGPVQARMPLVIDERRFEIRRLRVPERFVDPPLAERRRIAQEASRLAEIFGRSDPARLWRGSFTLPVVGPPTSSFGRRTVMNGVPRGQHRGTDFRAAEGTPVRAPNAGFVVLAADLYFTGNTVIVDHGLGLFSVFAHLSRMAVREGMPVSGGDFLGEAGATGRVTGPHLHWTVRLGEAALDPLSLVAALDGLFDPPEL